MLQVCGTIARPQPFKSELLRIEVIEVIDRHLAGEAAAHYRDLRKHGRTVRTTIDLLLATFCIREQHALLHRDRDFDVFERHLGLQVVQTWPPAKLLPGASDSGKMTMLFAALLGLALQSSDFAGTWVADIQGTVFVRLELRDTNGSFDGTLATGNIKVGANGAVIDATMAPAMPTKLTKVRTAGGELRIERPEGSVMEDFGVRLVGADRAELTFYPPDEVLEQLKAEGIPLPQPIPLRRVR